MRSCTLFWKASSVTVILCVFAFGVADWGFSLAHVATGAITGLVFDETGARMRPLRQLRSRCRSDPVLELTGQFLRQEVGCHSLRDDRPGEQTQ